MAAGPPAERLIRWFGGLTSESHSLDAADATTVGALFRMSSPVLPPRREFLANQVARVLRHELQAGRSSSAKWPRQSVF